MRSKIFTIAMALMVCAGELFAAKVKIGDLYYNLNDAHKTASVTYQVEPSDTPSGNYAGLKNVVIPTSVKNGGKNYNVVSVAESAFEQSASIISVVIPEGVKSIEKRAFCSCPNLVSISLPNGLTSIGKDVFNGSKSLESIEIPNSVTSIGSDAFNGCKGLLSANIPSSVQTLGSNIFEGCTQLTIYLNSSSIVATDYKSSAGLVAIFGSQVKEYILGDDITRIGNHAFYDCIGLSKITIGANVEEIGNYAFENCKNIDVIIVNAKTAPTITKKTFKNMGNKAYVYIYVPEGRDRAYKRDQFWGEFDIYVQGQEPQEEK
ncbi:MAG: leucine-rich repeat domain-containing protein [Paludibacteraceae bacterium]|nr:leucine-rich repeat domain-containing protein [Paludibacteraceae bacterium]